MTGCLLALLGSEIAGGQAAVAGHPPVELRDQGGKVVLANGRIEATIAKAHSTITSLRFGPHQMVAGNRPIYYSMGGGRSYRQPRGAEYRVVRQDPDHAEVAFLQKWQPAAHGSQAVDIEVHYALRRGQNGVFTYGVLSHPAAYPDGSVGEWRLVWGMPKINDREWLMEKIRVDQMRDWEMPSPADLAKARPTPIAEIVELTTGHRAGKFDCKYDFNLEYHSVGCWGHASDRHRVGAWIVLPSHEFFNDGPMKHDLSSASNLIHIHFGMNHYAGSSTRLQAGQAWRKIYGPFLLYCNEGGSADELWADARAKAAAERRSWPYDWVGRDDLYPPAASRGTLRGTLTIRDPLKPAVSSAGAWVGLSQPPPGGNFQHESNHYQYWTKADPQGRFEIRHARPGTYTLSAFTNGVVGEFERREVAIKAGENQAGDLVWEVPRLGKSLAWEIGIPDRRAAEFRHSDDYFHGYVWRYFSKEFPNPLVFTIGRSDFRRDWNYAQGSYLVKDRPVAWPWQVRFRLKQAPETGEARLILALASAHRARVEVKVNGKLIQHFYPAIPAGNTLLRQAAHSKYQLVTLDFPGALLRSGENEITLTQTRQEGAAVHVMYDYVALEVP
jgi:rhamnogalacturonan endolyase